MTKHYDSEPVVCHIKNSKWDTALGSSKKLFWNSYKIELKNYFQIAPKYKNLGDISWLNEMGVKRLFRITIHRDTPFGTNKIQTIS